MSLTSLAIRPALIGDESFVAEMILLSMGHLAEYLFEAEQGSLQKKMSTLVARNAGRFGLTLAHVAEVGGKRYGAVLVCKGKNVDRLNLATFPHLFPSLGVRLAWMFIWRGMRLPGGREAEADEYYISNVGVLPSVQGRGVGSALLKFAEERAHAEGLKKCSLVVGLYNQDAFRLYQRSGYQVVETVQADNPTLAYHRMLKVL